MSYWFCFCGEMLIPLANTEVKTLAEGYPLKIQFMEFPLWLSGLRTCHSLCEDAGLILGLA